MPPKNQIAITLTPREREIAQEIADELELPLATVLRDAAIEGLDSQIAKAQRRREFLERKNIKGEK